MGMRDSFQDLCLVPGPRIITSNSSEPHEWHEEFPKGLLTMSSDARQSLSPDCRALLKRLSFCTVSTSLFPVVGAKRQADPLVAERALKVRRLLATELA